jgi:hypothetical protein
MHGEPQEQMRRTRDLARQHGADHVHGDGLALPSERVGLRHHFDDHVRHELDVDRCRQAAHRRLERWGVLAREISREDVAMVDPRHGNAL